jgi:hypothetical protein
MIPLHSISIAHKHFVNKRNSIQQYSHVYNTRFAAAVHI